MTVIQDALPPLDAIETAPTDLYRPEWAAPQELPTEMDEGAAHLLAALVPMQVQPPLTSPAGARGLPAAAARGDQVSMLVGREADQASVSADVASRMGRARVMSALAPISAQGQTELVRNNRLNADQAGTHGSAVLNDFNGPSRAGHNAAANPVGARQGATPGSALSGEAAGSIVGRALPAAAMNTASGKDAPHPPGVESCVPLPAFAAVANGSPQVRAALAQQPLPSAPGMPTPGTGLPSAKPATYLEVPFDNGRLSGVVVVDKPPAVNPVPLFQLKANSQELAAHLRSHVEQLDNPAWQLNREQGSSEHSGQGAHDEEEAAQPPAQRKRDAQPKGPLA